MKTHANDHATAVIDSDGRVVWTGPTKRELLAAFIMAGRASIPGPIDEHSARHAVRGADLLIEELNKDTES